MPNVRLETMHVLTHSGFGGLVPKIAGSIPAKAVGFFGQKIPQQAFLRRGSKAICPMSQIYGMLKPLWLT
jgi:hypothetical protein